MLKDIVAIFAGLGLFSAGLHLLTSTLRKVSGRSFRRTLSRWTQGGARGVLWGMAAGALSQSMTAVLFMLIGLVRSGALAVDATLPLLAGANLGSSALALLTAVDLNTITLVVLGLSGFAVAREKASVSRTASLLFELGLLFFGLEEIKAGAAPLLEVGWIQSLFQQSGGSLALSLMVGLGLRLVVHSSIAIVILAAVLTVAKIIALSQAVAVVAGVVAGSAGAAWMLSLRHRGRARQIAAMAVLTNLVGAAALALALLVKDGSGNPAVLALLTAVSDRPELQVACALLLAYLPGLALVPLRQRIAQALAPLWPPSDEDSEGACRFIRDDALADPESAVDLAVLEQRDLVRAFSRALDQLRRKGDIEGLRLAFGQRCRAMAEFLEELATADLTNESYERLAALSNGQRTIESIGATVHELAGEIEGCDSRLATLTDTIVEATDGVLLTLEAVIDQPDAEEMQMLRAMTGNRGPTLQYLRECFIQNEGELDQALRLQLLTVTNLCERLFWLLAALLDSPVCELPVDPRQAVAQPMTA